jgi:hypothetical protein
MAKRRRLKRITMKVQENVSQELKRIDVRLKGPTVDQALMAGADYLAGAVRPKSPHRTGLMREGIYTVSAYRDNHPGKKAVKRLKSRPKPGTVVLVGGTFYQKFVEYGRKSRKRLKATTESAGRRKVGRLKRRPFFRAAIQSGLPSARMIVTKRLQRVIEANR